MLFIAFMVNAQDKSEFNPYWYLQLQGGAAYTVGETADFMSLVSPAAAINLGYQFAPAWAARLNVNGWQGKGIITTHDLGYKFNYAQAGVDVLMNLAQLGGYKADKVFNPYIFAGAACNVAFNNGAPARVDYPEQLANRWDPTSSCPSFRTE